MNNPEIERIEFEFHPQCGWTVKHNGCVIMECLSKEEINALTLGEIEYLEREFMMEPELEDKYYDDPIVQEGARQQDIIDMYRREK